MEWENNALPVFPIKVEPFNCLPAHKHSHSGILDRLFGCRLFKRQKRINAGFNICSLWRWWEGVWRHSPRERMCYIYPLCENIPWSTERKGVTGYIEMGSSGFSNCGIAEQNFPLTNRSACFVSVLKVKCWELFRQSVNNLRIRRRTCVSSCPVCLVLWPGFLGSSKTSKPPSISITASQEGWASSLKTACSAEWSTSTALQRRGGSLVTSATCSMQRCHALALFDVTHLGLKLLWPLPARHYTPPFPL